ncbi:MAG: hypothetical protein HXX09_02640 [Bacteroidetes bacterium]|nr:hypothetical protein [Bacteroidota bacterium]
MALVTNERRQLGHSSLAITIYKEFFYKLMELKIERVAEPVEVQATTANILSTGASTGSATRDIFSFYSSTIIPTTFAKFIFLN